MRKKLAPRASRSSIMLFTVMALIVFSSSAYPTLACAQLQSKAIYVNVLQTCDQHEIQVTMTVEPRVIFLKNGTKIIKITIEWSKPMEYKTSDIELLVRLPESLENKVLINGTRCYNESFKFEVAKDIIIDESRNIVYYLNFTFENIDCTTISKSLNKNITLTARFIAYEKDSQTVNITIHAASSDLLRACFNTLNLYARGSWTGEGLQLNLLVQSPSNLTISIPVDKPFNFSIKGLSIQNCSPISLCEINNGVAVLKGDIRFLNLSVMLPPEALEKDYIEVYVNFCDRSRLLYLKPKLIIADTRFENGVLNFVLRNDGNLSYDASKCRVAYQDTERTVKLYELEKVIINPEEEKVLKYNITIVNSRKLIDYLNILFNFGNTFKEIVFNIKLSKLEVRFLQDNEIEVAIRIDSSNSSLRLEIPIEVPLRVDIEGFNVINCTASMMKCVCKDESVLVYGNVTLPSTITLKLSVRDKGGSENRKVRVTLNERLKLEGFLNFKKNQRFYLLILGVAVVVVIVVLSVVLMLRKRPTSPEDEEEAYFDLG